MQQGLNWNGIEEHHSILKQYSLVNGLPEGYGMNQFQWSIARENPEHAALLGIYENISKENRKYIKDSFDSKGNYGPKLEDEFSGVLKTYESQIIASANNHLPGTIQNTAQKGWHIALIKQVLRNMVLEGSENKPKYRDIMQALPDAMRRLYGYWGKTYRTGGPVRVALPYKLTNDRSGAGVDQDDWEDALHFTYANAQYLWGPDLALVAREGVAKGVKGLYPTEQEEFEKGIETKKDTSQSRFIGTNRYNPDWNIIKKHWITNGAGNLWVSRINDPDDPSRIRLVIMAGDRDYPTDVEIVGDLYRTDENGKAIPVSFSAEEMVNMMASRQAWQAMDSDDDSWDWIDPFTYMARAFTALRTGNMGEYFESAGEIHNTDRSFSDRKNISIGEERNRWTERGGDFGRENIDYYHNKYSKDVAGSDYHKLDANAFGGSWLTEWSDPGRVEMNMYIDPLWHQIQILEKSKSEELGKPYQINDEEFRQLFELIKSRLNGTRGLFSGETPMTYFDSFFSDVPQDRWERLRTRRTGLQTWQRAVRD